MSIIFISCSQEKKENNTQLITKITDSISKDIELKVRTKIKDSLKFESEEEEYLSKLADVNFYKWKRKFLLEFKEKNEGGFEDKILENTSGNLTIGYKRNLKLKGIYKGKDKVLSFFFEAVRDCPEVLPLFKGDYELNLYQKEKYFPVVHLSEDIINSIDYSCHCSFFDKANVIKNDTIYSLHILRGDCRGIIHKQKNGISKIFMINFAGKKWTL